MSVTLTDEELRTELYFHTNPLVQIKEAKDEWWLGTWSLSKFDRTWRVGYGHQLVAGATFRTFPFDIDGKRGIGVLFESASEPPWYMAGWVQPEREKEAEAWTAFLNSEIANRLADRPAGENTTFDPHDGSTAADIEDQRAMERMEHRKGKQPSKLVK